MAKRSLVGCRCAISEGHLGVSLPKAARDGRERLGDCQEVFSDAAWCLVPEFVSARDSRGCPVATDDHAERIIGCAKTCALQGGSVSVVAWPCASLADEIEEAFGHVHGESIRVPCCGDDGRTADGVSGAARAAGRRGGR